MNRIIAISLMIAGVGCLSACKPATYYPFGHKPGANTAPLYYAPATGQPVRAGQRTSQPAQSPNYLNQSSQVILPSKPTLNQAM